MLRRACAAATALAVLVVAAPAHGRAPGCGAAPPAGAVGKDTPYEARLYDPARLAPLATGAGVRVAVLDSGVDAGHPQLRGAVAPGRDLLRGGSDGRQDCVGHGTAVAGLIAARPAGGVPVRGLAPGATIVPVRVTERQQIGGADAGPGDFARAIDWAADPRRGGARVLNLSVTMTGDDPRVRRAVARAVAAGVVVVAAAGNDDGEGGPGSYPAAYPGVIGVGAVTADGVRAPFSRRGGHVDLVAAGAAVTAPAPSGGHVAVSGTSYAAPFVAATAALLLQRFGDLGPERVRQRLVATADPAPGGGRSDEYGHGLLNPYRALTETLGGGVAAAAAPVTRAAVDPAAVAAAQRRVRARDRALLVAAAGAAVAVLAVLGAGVLRRGRRRGWRPA